MEPTLLSPAHSNHSTYDSKEHVKELEFYKNLAAKAASLANHHQRDTSSASPLPMQIDADADDEDVEEQAAEQAMRLRREEQAQAKAFAAHLNGTSEYISKAKRKEFNKWKGNCQLSE